MTELHKSLLPLGGSIAASWAVLRSMGQDGYMEVAEKLMQVAAIMKEGVNSTEVRGQHRHHTPPLIN